MSIVRFVHAADLHLDSPFRGLRNSAPLIAGALSEATFKAYNNIIDLCLEERVDALLVAGDVFDGGDRSLRAQLKFASGLERLHQAGIRSFICHGNHDPLDGWEARLTMPPSCHRFGPTVGRAPVFESEPHRAVVQGVSYPRREVRENLVPLFGAAEPGTFNIGLLHANVDNNAEHDSYAPCSLTDLERSGIDYWALGHVHTRQILRRANPTVVYPGNPQGRHPNERGARGVYLVDVSDSGLVSAEFRAVDLVRWDTAEIDIRDLETEQDLLNAIESTLQSLREEADGRSLLARISLAGRGELHRSLRRAEFLDGLLESVNGAGAHQEPFVWCERIQVATAVPFDRERRRQGTDFLADLLRLCDEARDSEETLAAMGELLADLYVRGNPGRYLRDRIPAGADLRDLLAGAEELCLAELLEEESE